MNTKAIIAPLISLGVCLSPSIYADTLGLYAGAGVWSPDLSGEIADDGRNVDVQSELGLDADTANIIYIALEHPVPLLPNVRLQYTDLSSVGAGELDTALEFGGETFPAGTETVSNVDLTHADATFYYQLVDTVIGIDLGATVRVFDGSAMIAGDDGFGGTISASEDFSAPVPMLYGRLGFKLPLTGLTADVRVNYIDISGDQVMDMVARINYEVSFGLGLEAGYRTFDVDIDDDGFVIDTRIDGVYAGISYHF